MGLDGISLNQLRITPDNNSRELNNNIKSEFNERKIVDGLSSSQRVLSNKEKNHDSKENNQEQNFSDSQEKLLINEKTIKYDLSKTDKYSINVEDDEIVITEKDTNDVVQIINASELARFINFLPESKGAIVNRKF